MVGVRQREVTFDSRPDVDGGGLSLSLNTVTFEKEHNLVEGEELVYLNNGNNNLGVGTTGFTNDSLYYPEVINNKTVRFYPSRSDLDNRINSVQFSNIGQGYHKFKKAVYTNTLRAIKVIDSGSGYT